MKPTNGQKLSEQFVDFIDLTDENLEEINVPELGRMQGGFGGFGFGSCGFFGGSCGFGGNFVLLVPAFSGSCGSCGFGGGFFGGSCGFGDGFFGDGFFGGSCDGF